MFTKGLHTTLKFFLTALVVGGLSFFTLVAASPVQAQNPCAPADIKVPAGQTLPSINGTRLIFSGKTYFSNQQECYDSLVGMGLCCTGGELQVGATPGECNAMGGQIVQSPSQCLDTNTTTRISDGQCLKSDTLSVDYVCNTGKSYSDASCPETNTRCGVQTCNELNSTGCQQNSDRCFFNTTTNQCINKTPAGTCSPMTNSSSTTPCVNNQGHVNPTACPAGQHIMCGPNTGTGGPNPTATPLTGVCCMNGANQYDMTPGECNAAGGVPQACSGFCRDYNNVDTCDQHSNCEWEGGYCQEKDEGATLGNNGLCRDINGNPTDAVCYACPDTTNPAGGCQLNGQTINVNGGNVPNASSYGSRVDYCGIVQCDCKGTGAGSGYAIPLVFTSQVFNSQCGGSNGPVTTTNYACVNGTCQATTGSGYPTMTQCQENCSTPTPTPPGATPTPTPPVIVDYACNSGCSTDAQCKTEDSRFICANTDQGKRCRLAANVSSPLCRTVVGPQCLSITMNSVTNPEAPANSQPTVGDAVRFTCGEVSTAERYIFRIFSDGESAVELESTGNVSEPYTLLTPGPYSAQCQICTGQDDSTCLPFEDPTPED